MKLFQNQIFKASVAFIVFSNILMLNKYYNGLHWMNGFAFATHGLIPFLLTVLSVITLLASLIFMLQGTKKFILFENPLLRLVVKLISVILFGVILTEFAGAISRVVVILAGLNPFSGYRP
jgi:hypothetical protein